MIYLNAYMKVRPIIILLLKTVLLAAASTVSVLMSVMVFGIFILIFLSVGIAVFTPDSDTSEYEVIYGKEESPVRFLSVPVSGIIVGSKSDISDPYGLVSDFVTYGYDVKEDLYAASSDETIAGVLVEINSPGGTIYGAKAIADGLMYYTQNTQKPAVSFVSGLATSGGYWAGIGADAVYADSGSVLGSIGIISGPFKFYNSPLAEDGGILEGGIVTDRGIETTYITAGLHKDIGNPYRRLTQEEIQALQRMVDNSYDQFVQYVSQRRNVSEQFLRNELGAIIVDPVQAIDMKLIDGEMNREQAYRELALRAGADPEDFSVIMKKQKQGLVDILLASYFSSKSAPQACPLLSKILAYYGDVSSLCTQ